MTWPAAVIDPHSGETILNLVRISHADWPADRLYVANTQDVVSNGDTFTASAFAISIPDKVEGRSGPMQFQVYDIDNALMADLRAAEGPVTVEVSWVLASDPDTVHIGPFSAEIWQASHKFGILSGALTAWPVMDEKANATLRFNTIDWPGLY